MMRNQSIWVAIVVALGVIYVASKAMPPRSTGPLQIHEFGRLPCVADGREKPYDTFARNTMMMISDRQTFFDTAGERRPAIEWLADVMAGSPAAFEHKVFRIDNPQVLAFLGLEPRLDRKYKYRYAFSEFGFKEDEIRQRAMQASERPDDQKDAFDRQILRLWGMLQGFIAIYQWHAPYSVPPAARDGQWKPLLTAMADGLRLSGSAEGMRRLVGLVTTEKTTALRLAMSGGTEELPIELDPTARKVAGILLAYSQYAASDQMVRQIDAGQQIEGWDRKGLTKIRDAAAANFNSEVAALRTSVGMAMPSALDKSAFEVTFNRFEPFYQCMVLYVAGFLLVMIGMLTGTGTMIRGAFWLVVVAVIVHTFALVSRMYLMDRWFVFVTNLYSTGIFIAWGGVLLTLLLELFYRNGLALLAGTKTGFLSLLVAHNLAGDGKDTLEMMQAVLDTNFWLATHVTAINIGYMATFVAGFLAILYVILGLFTGHLNANLNKQLGTMIYGTLCFSILFSFTGTVLGGIWADQSWGRFWGWDPKENGALMIVIWTALILHARWGGMVRQRGVANLAIFGNIITAWSWFGTNELGVGLHAYGFTEGRAFWLMIFVLSQLAIIGLGLTPLRYWRSFKGPIPPREEGPQPLPAPV